MSVSERDQRDFQQAAGLHQAGQLPAAINGYRKILKRSPKLPVVLNLLGLAEFQSGQLEAAAQDLGKALSLDPSIPDIHYNLATVLQRLGRFEEAIPYFEQALAAKPGDAQARVNFGVALKAVERTDEAIREYQRAIEISPAFADAYFNLGNALSAIGKETEAIPQFNKAISLQPGNPAPFVSLGNALLALKRTDEAAQVLEKAILLDPQSAEPYANRGLALVALRKFDEAAGHFLRAVTLKPDFVEAYVELGNALAKMDKIEDAIQHYQRAIELRPDFVDAHYNLGECLLKLDRHEESYKALQVALSLKPDHAKALTSLAGYYFHKRDYDEVARLVEKSSAMDPSSVENLVISASRFAALDQDQNAVEQFERALELDNDDLQIEKSWHLGFLYLSVEYWEKGWDLFEYRFNRTRKAPPRRDYPVPRWNGKKLDGKLMLWAEQGLGDQIIYASMVPDALRATPDITIECSERLIPLFKRSFPGAEVVLEDAKQLYQGPIAAHCPFGSLGNIFRRSRDSFPKLDRGYLRADEALTEKLRKDVTADSKFAIGVSWWSKNPTIGEFKSARLMDLASLFRIQDARFVDMQYGDTLAERQQVESALDVIVSPHPEIDNTLNIDGLAALMSACDLIVTTSNTNAHLAAALGKHTWVLVPYGQGRIWYWHKRRTDSPWYPNVHLVRQALNEPWESVVSRAAQEVQSFLKAGSV
jgi:tetratricopeptide (TPR) repeat protein